MSAEEVIDAWIDPCGSDTGAGILRALEAAGYAVVQLPEPTATDDDGQLFFGEYDIRADPTGAAVHRGVTTDFGLGTEVRRTMSPSAARSWGLNLLAAAAAVESPVGVVRTTEPKERP